MKLVILDRDGTINQDSDDFIKSPEEWLPLPGALEAIARLNHAGWHVVVASNQSGLGRGLFDMSALNAMHVKMAKLLAALGGKVDAIFFCPHAPEDQCTCRKPLPGLFEQIGDRYSVDLRQVHAVGDTLRDVQAAHAAGCPTHLVLTGKGAMYAGQPLPVMFPQNTRVHADLMAFADWLLKQPVAGSKLAGTPAPSVSPHLASLPSTAFTAPLTAVAPLAASTPTPSP